jgi:hypothetical protein
MWFLPIAIIVFTLIVRRNCYLPLTSRCSRAWNIISLTGRMGSQAWVRFQGIEINNPDDGTDRKQEHYRKNHDRMSNLTGERFGRVWRVGW